MWSRLCILPGGAWMQTFAHLCVLMCAEHTGVVWQGGELGQGGPHLCVMDVSVVERLRGG